MIRIRDGREFMEELTGNKHGKPHDDVSHAVSGIIAEVLGGGDAALREIAARFGDDVRDDIALSPQEIADAIERVPLGHRAVIERAAEHIRLFAEAVMRSIVPITTAYNGWTAGINYRPVASAGCYVPGGRFPLPSSALMTAVTAKVAGVDRICIASPRMRDEVVFAGSLAGVTAFYAVGGAQAVAALAYGTASIPSVDMIAGPGNAYVTEAKRQLAGTVGIDMLAGPSEVAIIADSGASATALALDMLAQAEHDPRAQSYLFTDNTALAMAVAEEVVSHGRRMLGPAFDDSLAQFHFVAFDSLIACAEAADALAPEHLELMVADPADLATRVSHYGALFMGYNAAVPLGDYAAGPNHTLPTGRTARFAEGLNPRTFLRAQSWLAVDDPRMLAETAASFADIEGMSCHAASARARLAT